MNAIKPIRESAIRAMRDRVYGLKTSDKNWDGCKDFWLEEGQVKWLEDECARLDLSSGKGTKKK